MIFNTGLTHLGLEASKYNEVMREILKGQVNNTEFKHITVKLYNSINNWSKIKSI